MCELSVNKPNWNTLSNIRKEKKDFVHYENTSNVQISNYTPRFNFGAISLMELENNVGI